MSAPVEVPAAPSSRRWSARHLALAAGAVTVAGICWSRWNHPLQGGLFDFYPLYHGSRSLLGLGDAYLQDPALADIGQLSEVGNAYPLHGVILLGMPLGWVPAATAGIAFTALCGVAWLVSIVYSRASATWLLWWPMWDALRMQQASAVVTAAAIFALGASKRQHKWVFALSLLFMSIKPQQTVFLMIGLLWMHRDWWRQVGTVFVAAAMVTLVAQPHWVARWLEQVQRRGDLVEGEQWLTLLLVPAAAILLVRGWRLPALAVLSTGAGPWPLFGTYVVSMWPIGLDRVRGLALGVVGGLAYIAPHMALWTGFFTSGPTAAYWVRPVVLIVGTAVAALALPYATRPRAPTEARTTPLGQAPS